MTFTIKTRIILSYILLFGLMLSGFSLLVYRSFRDTAVSRLDSRLESHADKLETEIEEQHKDRIFPFIPDLMEIKTEGLDGVRYRILDRGGNAVLSDSVLAGSVPSAVGPLEGQKKEIGEASVGGQRYRQILAPVEIQGRNLYLLQVAAPMAGIEESLDHLRVLFLAGIPAALLLASLAAFIVIRAAFRPITSMVETARRISADNLDTRIPVPAVKDEIRLLGETFNAMIDRIHSAFEGQRRFIADASHEFRTPLTVICSELEFIQQQTKDDETRKSIQTALDEIDRLARMTEGLLTLSKLDDPARSLTIEPVRLDEVLVDCVRLLRTLAGQKGVDLQLRIEEAVEIEADPDKIKSAILNLLDNALRHTPGGGTVSVLLSVAGSPQHCVTIKVEDTGSGIPPADLPHVFKRFYRPARFRANSSGSGLGLAIVEQVAKAHGGTVSLRSELGKGTLVLFNLPLPSQKG